MTPEQFHLLVGKIKREFFGDSRFEAQYPHIQKVIKRKPKPNIDKEWNEFKKMLDWR